MSDVPFLSFSIIAIYCFVLALEKPGLLIFFIATAAGILSALTRQFGVIIPIAFAIAGLLQRKRPIAMRLAFVLPAVAIGWLLHFTMGRLEGKGYFPYSGSDVHEFLASPHLLLQFVYRGGFVLYYSGLCLLPLLLILGNPARGLSSKQKRVVAVFVLLCIPFLAVAWDALPEGNVFNFGYMGPFTVKGFRWNQVTIPPVFTALKCIAAFGGMLLMANVASLFITALHSLKSGDGDSNIKLKAFIAMCLLGYGALSCVPSFFFDRYILYFFPLFSMLIIPGQNHAIAAKRPVKMLAYIVTFMFAVYAVAGTHDYLSWNRVRWQIGDYLTKDMNISPHKIDGGYEFDGWYIGKWYPAQANKSWWYVDDDEYIISTEPQDGYTLIKTYTYNRYLSYGGGVLYIWQRKTN